MSCVEFRIKMRRATSGQRSASLQFSFGILCRVVKETKPHIRQGVCVGRWRWWWWWGGVTLCIWCVWIRFCSWLQQWDDSSDEWFFHICASKAKRGADMIRFIFRKKKQKQSQSGKEMNREMRKQSSKRQQNDWACHIFLLLLFSFIHKEDSSIQMQNCFAQEESWEALNTPLVSSSVQLFLQMALQKYQEKKFTFILLSP